MALCRGGGKARRCTASLCAFASHCGGQAFGARRVRGGRGRVALRRVRGGGGALRCALRKSATALPVPAPSPQKRNRSPRSRSLSAKAQPLSPLPLPLCSVLVRIAPHHFCPPCSSLRARSAQHRHLFPTARAPLRLMNTPFRRILFSAPFRRRAKKRGKKRSA